MARTQDSSGRLMPQQALSLRERDPVGYFLEQARHSAARRLGRVIRDGLDGKLEPEKLGSISIGLKAALAVLGLPSSYQQQQAPPSVNIAILSGDGTLLERPGGSLEGNGAALRIERGEGPSP